MTVRGCIERSGYFRSSILQKEGPLVPLFKWLDAEAVYYETDDDRKYYDKGSGSAYDYDSTSSAHAAPDFVEHFVVCLRANSNLPPTSASSPAPAAGFGMRIQAISPTAPFVVVQSEPPASAYGDVATHPLASHPLYREQLELQRQQAAMAAAASRQAAHVANRGSRNASIHAPPPAAAPTVPKTLQRGDHILAINGVSLRQLGLSYSDPQAGGEQANFAFAIAERLLGRLAAPGGWGVLLLVRRSRDFNRYVRQMDAAISGGSSSSSSSSSSASSSSSSVGLVRYHMPARPRWSFLLSELDVRAAAVSILPHERTGLRNFREPCAQWTRKCLIPELTSSLEQVIPQPAEMAAALESTFQRAMQLVNAISPLPPPSAFGASSSSSSSSSSSLALQIAIIRDLPALSATAHGYCSPLMFPHGKPNGSGVRPHLCTSGVGLPGSSSAVVSILEQQMVSLVEGMSKMPAQGRAGGIPGAWHIRQASLPPNNCCCGLFTASSPNRQRDHMRSFLVTPLSPCPFRTADIFYAFYEPPKYDSDEDGEVELLDGEVEAPKEAVALDLDAEHLSQPSAAPAARAAASSSSSRSAASNQPSSSHAGHKRPREEASTIVLEDSEVRFPGNSTNEPEIIELDDD